MIGTTVGPGVPLQPTVNTTPLDVYVFTDRNGLNQGAKHATKTAFQPFLTEVFPAGNPNESKESPCSPYARWLAHLMPCYHPLAARRDEAGKPIVLGSVKSMDGENYMEIPCGKCVGCRLRKKREWAVRCMHEAQTSVYPKGHPKEGVSRSSFITLTYDEEHLPEDHSINVKHWQNFAKKLRREKGQFRFLACGEYGEKNYRPHYHACVFGHDFTEDRVHWKDNKQGQPIFMSPSLTEIWGKGLTAIGQVDFDSAAYVAGYVTKKHTAAYKEKQYLRTSEETGAQWQVTPEFAVMSRRPGLGAEWFAKYHRDVYPDDCVIMKGQKFEVPRYYDTLKERLEDGEMEKIKALRRERINEENATRERLRIREQVAKARMENPRL